MDIKKILVINPGSTSTKIGYYENEKQIWIKTIHHSAEELSPFKKFIEQYDFRKNIILNALQNAQLDLKTLTAIIGRGGTLKPISGGVYRINEAMLLDSKYSPDEHASNLGILLSNEFAEMAGDIPALTADPPSTDEMEEIAKITGIPDIKRRSLFHALNQKAVAHMYAESISKKYEELNLIVVHLGGGISVGIHQKGKVVDTNNALDGDGPMSPERTGSIPAGQLVEMCFSGKYSKKEIMHKLVGEGGLKAYFGTNDFMELKRLIQNGNHRAELVYQAMAYQTAKEIGALAAVVSGKVDGILITGGIANDDTFVKLISDRIKFIAIVVVFPGENEMDILAQKCLKAMNNELEIKEYV